MTLSNSRKDLERCVDALAYRGRIPRSHSGGALSSSRLVQARAHDTFHSKDHGRRRMGDAGCARADLGRLVLFLRDCHRELPTFTIVFLRVGLGTATLWLIVWLLGPRPPRDIRTWRDFLIMGLLNNAIPFSLIVWGSTRSLRVLPRSSMPPRPSSPCSSPTPSPRMRNCRGTGSAVLDRACRRRGDDGRGCRARPCAAQAWHNSPSLRRPSSMRSAASSAAASLPCPRSSPRPGRRPAPRSSSCLSCSPSMHPGGCPFPHLPVVLAVAALALLCTSLAYVLYFTILKRAGATNLVLVTFLVPASAILLGLALLGESIAPQHTLGLITIGIGLALIDGRLIGVLRKMPRAW